MTCRFCQQWNPPGARRCCFCQNELDSAVDQTVEAQISAAQRGLAGSAPKALPPVERPAPHLSLFGYELRVDQLIWQGLVAGLVLLFLLFSFC